MKKKIVCLFIASFCFISITACSNSTDTQTNTTEENTSTIVPDYTRYVDKAEDVSESINNTTEESEEFQLQLDE